MVEFGGWLKRTGDAVSGGTGALDATYCGTAMWRLQDSASLLSSTLTFSLPSVGLRIEPPCRLGIQISITVSCELAACPK